MNKLALGSLSLVSLVGVAAAQPPAAPTKGAPAVPAEKKAPADKAPAPTADKAAPPEAPAELADLAKNMTGTWKCTGHGELGGQMLDIKATIAHRLDPTLNKFWLWTSFNGIAAKQPIKFTAYTTYDAAAKKLWRVSVNARGGHAVAWGTIADKKITWEGDARWVGGIDVKTRQTEEMVSPKEVAVSGEYSRDGGKTWSKDHEATCKK